jgi:hypothetical protein
LPCGSSVMSILLRPAGQRCLRGQLSSNVRQHKKPRSEAMCSLLSRRTNARAPVSAAIARAWVSCPTLQGRLRGVTASQRSHPTLGCSASRSASPEPGSPLSVRAWCRRQTSVCGFAVGLPWRRTWTRRCSPSRRLTIRTSLVSLLMPAHAGCTVLPNPSLKLTRYGMRRKPGPRHMVHHRSPGLQRMPPRAA